VTVATTVVLDTTAFMWLRMSRMTQELGAMQQQTTIDAYEEPSLEDLRAERVQTHSFLASVVLESVLHL
jgi:hypothetical protein